MVTGGGGQAGGNGGIGHRKKDIAGVLRVAPHPAVQAGIPGIRPGGKGLGDLAVPGKGGAQHGALQRVVAEDAPPPEPVPHGAVEGVHVDQALAREHGAAEQIHVPLADRRGVGQGAALGEQAGEKGPAGGLQRHLAPGRDAAVAPGNGPGNRVADRPVQGVAGHGRQPPQGAEGKLRIRVQRHHVAGGGQALRLAEQVFKGAAVPIPQKAHQGDHRPAFALQPCVFLLRGGPLPPAHRRGKTAAVIPVQPIDHPFHRGQIRRVLRQRRRRGVLFIQQQHQPHAAAPGGVVHPGEMFVQGLGFARGGQQPCDHRQHGVFRADLPLLLHGAQGHGGKEPRPRRLAQGEQRRRQGQPQHDRIQDMARPQGRARAEGKAQQGLRRQITDGGLTPVLPQGQVKAHVPVGFGGPGPRQRLPGKVRLALPRLFCAPDHRPAILGFGGVAHVPVVAGGILRQQLFRRADGRRQRVEIHVFQRQQRLHAGAGRGARRRIPGQLLHGAFRRTAGEIRPRRRSQQGAVGKIRRCRRQPPYQRFLLRQNALRAQRLPLTQQAGEPLRLAAGGPQRVFQRRLQRREVVLHPRRRFGGPAGLCRLPGVPPQPPPGLCDGVCDVFHSANAPVFSFNRSVDWTGRFYAPRQRR